MWWLKLLKENEEWRQVSIKLCYIGKKEKKKTVVPAVWTDSGADQRRYCKIPDYI